MPAGGRGCLRPPPGQIAGLPVAEGDAVSEGQVLLEIWNEDLKSEIELSQRNLIAERSRAAESCTRANLAAREAVRLAKLHEDNLVSEGGQGARPGPKRKRALPPARRQMIPHAPPSRAWR